jgi:hypothetical protein
MGIASILLCIGIYAAGSFIPDRQRLNSPAFQFVPDTSPLVGIDHGHRETFSTGHLDVAGNFIPDGPFINRNVHRGRSASPPFRFINTSGSLPEMEAYEYRSGRLLKGKINKDGDFVPDLDSKVISLESYLEHYDPDKSPEIYNLPGRIVKKGSK